jgi:hypothetical protein
VTPAIFEGWSHRYVVNNSNFGDYANYTLGTPLTNVTGEGTPCSTGLYIDTTLARNSSISNFRCVPDVVFDAFGTVVGQGGSFSLSGGNYFYLYGKNQDGSVKSISGSDLLTSAAAVKLGGSNNGFDQTNSISFELNTENDVAVLEMTYYVYDADGNYVGVEREKLSFPSKDVTGGYTMSFAITYSLSADGVYTAANTASVTCPAGTLSATVNSGSGVVGLDGIPDITLEPGSSKNFPVYFRTSSGSITTSPIVLYTGSAEDPEFVADLDEAIERSFLGYQSEDSKCTDPVLPEDCPDVIEPGDDWQSCTDYETNLVVGATMGTQAQMDAVYGTGPIEFGGGIRLVSKLSYNPAQGTDPYDLPTYDTVEFASLEEGIFDTDLPCAGPVLGLRPQEGLSNGRLTIFSAAEMASFQYQGDYTDTTADPPRKLVNDTVTGGYRALLHCPAYTGSTKIIELTVPVKVYGSGLMVGTYWFLAWDRTAKQITLSQSDGTTKVIAYDGGPLIDLTVDASVYIACEPIPDSGGFYQRTDDVSATITVNGIASVVSSVTVSGLLVNEQWLGHYSGVANGTILGAAVRVLAITKDSGPEFDAIVTGIKRSFPIYELPTN